MSDKTAQSIAEGFPTKKPWSCRFGFHKNVYRQQLITTGHAVCMSCGAAWMTSMFGDFSLPKSEAQKVYSEVRKIIQGE